MTDISQVRVLSTVATLDAQQYEAGARKIDAANKQIAASEGQAQVATEKMGRALNVTERSIQSLESRLGGVSKASAELARAQTMQAQAAERANAGLAAGTISEARANQIKADAAKLVQTRTVALQEAQRIETVASLQATAHAAAQGKLGDATKLSAFQLQQLSFQMNDVVTGLASGQRPFQILAQQGGQITQSFGGVSAMMGVVRAQIAAIGAPILGASAAFVGLVGAFALGISRAGELDHQLKALKTTLASTGGATGMSAADLQSATNAFARQPGVSRDTATQAAQGLASNPLVNADLLKRALPTVRDFAAATGKDIPDAARAMAAALTGGYSAAKQLDAQFQILSVKELEQIRNLEEQGRKGEAANIVLEAMQRQWKGLADGGLTEAAKAANSFGNAWDNLMDRLARSGPITFARDRLIDLMRAAGGQTDTRTKTTAAGLGASGTIGQGILAFIGALGLAGAPAGATDNTAAGSVLGGLSGIQHAAEPATAALTKFNAAAAGGKGALHDLGIAANDAAKGLDPAAEEMKRLANMQALLTTAMANGKITAEDYAKAMALLGISMSQVQTPENLLEMLRLQATRAGMAPAAGAGFDAAERLRLAGATQEQQDEARRLGIQGYGAGQGQALGQQIGGIQATVSGSDAVVAAYAKSTEAGRRAELQLRALEAQWENGAEAVKAYADALIKQDAAQRRIEGARDLAKLKDDIADTQKLNDALAQGTIEYERQKIAIEAATKVRQGYLTGAQGTQYEGALNDKRRAELQGQAIDMSRRASPQAQLADDMARLNELMATGALSQDAYNLKVREYNDLAREQKDRLSDLGSGFESIGDGIASAAHQYARANTDFRLGQQIFEGSVDIMTRALEDFATTGQISFRKIADSFATMLLEMAAKKAASGLMDVLGSLFSSVIGSIGGSIGGGFGGGNLGFGAEHILGFAEGGRPPVGRVSVVGERGPELWVPDQAGTVYNQGQMAAMGGGGDVHVTNVISFGATGDKMITRADMVQWANDVERRTKASIVDMKRRGALRGSFA